MLRNHKNRTHKSQKNQAGGISSKTNIYTENLCFSLLGLVIISSVKFLSKWFIVQQHLHNFWGCKYSDFFFFCSHHILLLWPSVWTVIGNVFKVKFFLPEAENKILSFKLNWWSVHFEKSDLGEQSWPQTQSREINKTAPGLSESCTFSCSKHQGGRDAEGRAGRKNSEVMPQNSQISCD